MLTALAILGVIALIVLIAGVVLIAVTLSRTLSKQADVLDNAHDRWVASLEPLFDRLMAHNWEEYVTIRQLGEEEEGEFLSPEEQGEQDGTASVPRWGSLTGPPFVTRHSAEEERLLAEDFSDEGEPIRGASS